MEIDKLKFRGEIFLQQRLNVRDSSMELLRIISMIMIVFYHFAVHGGFSFGTTLSISHLWYNFILMGGKIGVNIFVLISGYFLINTSKTFDIIKIIKFIGQVFFYSVGIFVICSVTGVIDWSMKSLIKAMFPITFSQWWFTSAYFVLYLLHPYLNRLLCSIEKPTYQRLLLLLVVCWSIIPTFTTSSFQSNPLLWFVTLYSIAGYIRLYGLNMKYATKHYFMCYLICSAITYSSSIIFTVLGSKWDLFSQYTTYFYGQEKLTTLSISLCLFMCFSTLKMNYHKWINTMASATFGVYLIHDNSIVRKLLWLDWFRNAEYQDSLLLIPYSIFTVATVYIVCSAVDLLRQYIVEIPCMKIVKRYSHKVIVLLENRTSILVDLIFGKKYT